MKKKKQRGLIESIRKPLPEKTGGPIGGKKGKKGYTRKQKNTKKFYDYEDE